MNDLKYLPYTYWLIGIFFVVFVIQIAANLTSILWLNPIAISHGDMLWGLVTSIFIHGGFYHLLFNSLTLFFFGSMLERIVGRKEFLKIFFASGIFASIFYVLTNLLVLQDPTPALGASGAIFGVLGALVMLRPNTVIYFYFFLPMKLWQFAIFYVIIVALWFGSGVHTGIAENAHLGGMLIGLLFGYLYKQKEELDPEEAYWRVYYQ